jgi:phosphatidylglycerophosphatase C
MTTEQPPKILALDFDGTITKTDTCLLFMLWYNKQKGKSNWWYFFFLFFYLIGFISNTKYKEYIAREIKNQEEKEIDFKKFHEEQCRLVIRDSVKKIIEQHKRQNAVILLISASFTEWINYAVADLQADAVIANSFEKNREGKYTGRISGDNIYGKNKTTSLRQYLSEKGLSLSDVVSYSDNYTDIELLRAVSKGYLVNPSFITRVRFAMTGRKPNKPVSLIKL